MTDELNKLKKVFESEPEIKAPEHAKKIAMNTAMKAFEAHQTSTKEDSIEQQEKENVKKLQGNSIDQRLNKEDNIHTDKHTEKNVGLFNLSYWRKLMKLSYLFPVAAAGTLAVSVLVLNPQLLNNKNSAVILGDSKPLKKDIITTPASEPAYNIPVLADRDDGVTDMLKEMPVAESRQEGIAANAPAPSISARSVAKAKANQTIRPAPVRVDKIDSASLGSIVAPKFVAEFEDEESPVAQPSEQGRDKFESIKSNPLKLTKKEPVSTFSIDVDTASYSFMRAAINRNSLPQKDAVRIEELINYFPYDYQQPSDSDQPFQVSTTVMPTPWNTNTKLLHIGIKGYQLPKQELPKSNLVFLLDTSGSMSQPNKLPLLINSFKLLLSTLHADDTVSIVAYAGSAGTVLEPTKVKNKAKITQALERLNAGGSTAGGAGIRLAYQLAEANYDKKAVNRVILATDGDFNVGINNREELKSYIERKRKSGVFLSVLGFGMGNYNDALMQTLAQNGNGNAAYIDSLSEARKVLVEEASSTLFTIAKDVKIQMEFNPKAISQYRLIGYETRTLKREDFNNDKVDAGDIGAGHTVTAIYEITPIGAEKNLVDPLRYGDKKDGKILEKQTEYGFLKLRYKLPDEDKSKLIKTPIQVANSSESITSVSSETRFATAVAAFGQLLRGGTHTNSYTYDDVIELAQSAKGKDLFGYRAEFITLVRLAKTAEALRSQ